MNAATNILFETVEKQQQILSRNVPITKLKMLEIVRHIGFFLLQLKQTKWSLELMISTLSQLIIGPTLTLADLSSVSESAIFESTICLRVLIFSSILTSYKKSNTQIDFILTEETVFVIYISYNLKKIRNLFLEN